ncbi:unnamed protein product [Prorocentrum cordatum]|uniref:Reverse transcriptase domain-containing protein n=1 Tax=Prorocentrum cordatum TaxID=2364126 RepID=A0ABN9UTI0_9DINO|nr:unnamed protein product [Polarella glacialis]
MPQAAGRAAEGQIRETERVWRVSVLPSRGGANAKRSARRVRVEAGALQVCSTARVHHPKYYHVSCLGRVLGRAAQVEELTTLPATLQEEVAPWLEAPPAGPPPADAGMGGPAKQDADESNMHLPDIEVIPSAVVLPEPGILHRMSWWSAAGASAMGEARASIDSLLANLASTLDGVPNSLALAISEAREAVSTYILQATSEAEALGGWRCLLCVDRMLFGGLHAGRGSVADTTVTAKVSERLQDFWAGRWQTLLCDTAITSRDGGALDMKDRPVHRVRSLLMKGELGRAAAAAWGAAAMRTPAETAEAFVQQGPQEPDGHDVNGPADAESAHQLRRDVEECLRGHWRKVPQGAGAGPQGDAFKHWQPLAHAAGRGEATARVLATLAGGDAPMEALTLALAGRLLGLAKKDDGARVLACGSVPRRLVGRAVCKARRAAIADAVGDCQYGVGQSSGTEALHKTLRAKAEQFPDHADVSLDMAHAFRCVRRRSVFRALRARCPDMEPLARQWYDRPTTHVASGGGNAAKLVQQLHGLDQGCPLSPALFAIAVALALEGLRDFARQRSADSWVYAYLDDVYLVVPRLHLRSVLAEARRLFSELGLHLREPKTRLWFPAGPPADLPADLAQYVVRELPCLGRRVSFVRPRPREQRDEEDGRDVPAGVEDAEAPGLATERLRTYAGKLFHPLAAGLEAQHVVTLLRCYVNGAVTHCQRARVATAGAWQCYKEAVAAAMSSLLGAPLSDDSKVLLSLPLKLGGAGFQSATLRADGAWVASWAAVEDAVRADQGLPTEAAARAATPRLTAALATARARLGAAGAAAFASTQKELLQPTTRTEHLLGDDNFMVSLQRRLLVADPAEKHRRYPGPGLVAAALETGGRMGHEFRAFLRAKAPTDERRTASLADVRQRLATALQRGVAAMLLGRAGAQSWPWRTSCPAWRRAQ